MGSALFLFFYDPLTMAALFIAYIVGYIVLQLLAAKVAPRVASRLSGRMSLYTAMALTAALVVGGGILSAYGIYVAAAQLGYRIALGWLIGFLIAASIISYLASPWLINMMYRARPSPELQSIVDEAAARAGIKPPRAVMVEGPPNAFAYGNFLSGRYVAVSRSLYQMLTREELLGVVGHELGHHRHKDTVIITLLGLFPSLLYYMGVFLLRAGLWGGMGDREDNSGLLLAALGLLGVVLSFVMQVAVLTFSRLREYYADAHGASVAGARPMQRALAKLHLYYSSNERKLQELHRSSIKAMFIYAFTSAVANPFYEPAPFHSWAGDIDRVVEELKRMPVDPAQELLSDHPPIPKRLRFLDNVERGRI